MLPTAPLLLPVSAALLVLLYRYLKYGGRTELSEALSVDSTPSPQPLPSDLDPATLKEILKLYSKDIKKRKEEAQKSCDGKETENEIDPAILEVILKLYSKETENEIDPAILDGILKLCLKKKAEEEEAQKSCGWPETETGKENGNERPKEEKENGGEVGKKVVEENSERYEYPLRPEAGDCSYYLNTGTCKFGSNCKFNHPRRRKKLQVSKDKANEREESAEKPGQSECKYFLSGRCNYGNACRFNHGREELELNFLGLPIRPGKKECRYYMQNGSCKYGTNCRFNHPDPTAAEESDPPSRYGNGVPASLQGASPSTVPPWSAPSSSNESPLYVPMMIPPSHAIPSQNTEWNGYQAPAYLLERSMPAPPPYVMNNSVTETKVYEQYPQQKEAEEFPERPGQPICTYFSRTGDCRFKFNCKYHHPKNQTAVSHPCELSDKGLPLRPDQNICTHYSHYGSCNVGAACKFDHPTL